MRVWGALAVLWVAACNDGDNGQRSIPRHATDTDSGSAARSNATASAELSVHAFFDLPRGPLTQSLSGISTDGHTLFAVSDKRAALTTLTPNADYTEFAVAAGPLLAGQEASPWDGEALARASDGSFYVVANETTPRIVHFSATGEVLGEVPVPAKYAARHRTNKGLESLSLSPSGAFLFSCNEAALTGDGGLPTKELGTSVRLLRLPLTGTAAPSEYAYRTEPLGHGGPGDMGVADVLALSDDSLLVLERGYQPDFGNTVRLFKVSVASAVDASSQDGLGAAPPLLAKQLLVDLAKLSPGTAKHPANQPNPLLENYEALTFGPSLADGRRLLVLLSDDNGKASQVARVLVLALPTQ